jgi:hypothetical protein
VSKILTGAKCMSLCPLLKTECIENKCQWWQNSPTQKNQGCSIASISGRLDDVISRLDGINKRLDLAFSEVNIDGERLIGNYSDEIHEIVEDKSKNDK